MPAKQTQKKSDKILCTVCNKFVDRRGYANHTRSHETENWFAQLCDKLCLGWLYDFFSLQWLYHSLPSCLGLFRWPLIIIFVLYVISFASICKEQKGQIKLALEKGFYQGQCVFGFQEDCVDWGSL